MAEPRRALDAGQTLEKKYRVERQLDTGGYAEVYLASRLSDGLPVAIKALRVDAQHEDPAATDRFIREAALVARLEHPNLVRVLDFGRSERSVLYIVMERLIGHTLGSLLYGVPFEPCRVLHILRQILDGLVHAHGHGAVHRDLKPGNIFLCPLPASKPGGPADWVKILDFGFAKGLNKDMGRVMRRTLTLDGAIVGTPGYVAPELLTPGGKLTPLVDLYAVGVMGYEMLTGDPAFPGEGLERASMQLTSDPAVPPGFISESPLYHAICGLMARDPAERTQSAAEGLTELDALVACRGRIWM